jgi:hypothetical protein
MELGVPAGLPRWLTNSRRRCLGGLLRRHLALLSETTHFEFRERCPEIGRPLVDRYASDGADWSWQIWSCHPVPLLAASDTTLLALGRCFFWRLEFTLEGRELGASTKAVVSLTHSRAVQEILSIYQTTITKCRQISVYCIPLPSRELTLASIFLYSTH